MAATEGRALLATVSARLSSLSCAVICVLVVAPSVTLVPLALPPLTTANPPMPITQARAAPAKATPKVFAVDGGFFWPLGCDCCGCTGGMGDW